MYETVVPNGWADLDSHGRKGGQGYMTSGGEVWIQGSSIRGLGPTLQNRLAPPQGVADSNAFEVGIGYTLAMHAESDQVSGSLTPQDQEALDELVSYLSDLIPPLFFVGSMKLLFKVPPQVVVGQIIAWATRQFAPGGPLPTADYIFHAAKKIHLLAELELLPEKAVKQFLANLRPYLLEACPAADRESLAGDLDRMDLAAQVGAVGGVDVVYRRSGSAEEGRTRTRSEAAESLRGDPGLEGMAPSFVQGLKKLDFLLKNLSLQAAAKTGSSGEQKDSSPAQLQGEIVSQATTWVRSAKEMEKLLDELGKRGLQVSSDRVLGMLAERLPDWAPPPPDAASAESSPQGAVRAMGHFISMAQTKDERQLRYAELVDTAVKEFNGGSLGRAVTLLDLAGSMAEKKEVALLYAESVQRGAHGKLDQKMLREMVEQRENRQLLRRVLGFFQLMSPPELLRQLDGEPDRNKRKFILDLLRVHQSDARQVAFAELAEVHAGTKSFHWHYLRNLVHLLRTIPRDSTIPVENEIDVLVPMTSLDNEVPLIREALATFGQLSHDRAVTTLAARVNEVEEKLVGEPTDDFRPDQLLSLLDIMIKSLAKIGSPPARRFVVVHSLRRNARLGNTLERLTWLSDQDLSSEKDIVVRLIGEIRNELPKGGGLLGRSRKSERSRQILDPLVRTLTSTNTPEVIELLKEIKSHHASLPVAATAAEILARMEVRPGEVKKEPPPTLSGDLALFGLPNLLQNLADSQISGRLKVLGAGGGVAARVWMKDGLVLAAEAGKLRGAVAVYQLLENPAPGQFVFGETNEEPASDMRAEEPMSVQSVLFEGIRRYDEFNRAAAVVPDKAILGPTGAKPTPPEGETDGDLVREVWQRASAGYSPLDCEAEIPIDRFRIRCLYEHWVTEGSLEQAEGTKPGIHPS